MNQHLKAPLSKSEWETLHAWELGWAVLEPINIAKGEEAERELVKRLSAGQKALYFFWYLDAQVTNGGFIQFYINGYRKFMPLILDGLKLVGDQEMLALTEKADQEYVKNKDVFDAFDGENPEHLYEALEQFESYDEQYYNIHDNTMNLIEAYIRANATDFIDFID